MSPVQVFEFIDAEKTSFPIAFMCRRLDVSKAGYYAWKERPLAQRAVADARITVLIHQIHAGSRGTYGAPMVHAELADEHGVRCGRKRVARLMRIAQLRGVCRRRRVRTTQRDEQAQVSDDPVQRQFHASEPNALWIADIERHEALFNRAVMKGHRDAARRSGPVKLRAARSQRRGGRRTAAPTKPRRPQHCQIGRARQARWEGVREKPAPERSSSKAHQLKPDGYGLGSGAHSQQCEELLGR